MTMPSKVAVAAVAVVAIVVGGASCCDPVVRQRRRRRPAATAVPVAVTSAPTRLRAAVAPTAQHRRALRRSGGRDLSRRPIRFRSTCRDDPRRLVRRTSAGRMPVPPALIRTRLGRT